MVTNCDPIERIERRILMIRGHRVMLDADLAHLFGVPAKRLNEQVKRNGARFPSDFMFRLGRVEVLELIRSQFATASKRNVRYRPFHPTNLIFQFGTSSWDLY